MVKDFIEEKENNIIENMGSVSSQSVVDRRVDEKRSSVVFVWCLARVEGEQ